MTPHIFDYFFNLYLHCHHFQLLDFSSPNYISIISSLEDSYHKKGEHKLIFFFKKFLFVLPQI